jgi:hypothetical protein
MEATVTITLREIEKIKSDLKKLKEEKYELEKIVKPSHYFRIYYDFSRGTSVYNAFGYDVLNEDDVENKFDEIVKSNFENIFTQSVQVKFYNKFPKWVHRLLKSA